VTDFVCENDVRDALRQARKIFIGPKTIVTPAARELANQHDILVVARR
jgi:ethanolamine utilization cobalamin adenosyltransferase